jgi:hypothetical protein
LDLAEYGHVAVPELLAAYTPEGFELRVHTGSTLWIVDGLAIAELSAELVPLSRHIEGTGVIQRRIDMTRGKADHVKFELPETAQGQGRGRRVLRASVELYEALGIDEIELVAVDKGKYVWAAAGFRFATRRAGTRSSVESNSRRSSWGSRSSTSTLTPLSRGRSPSCPPRKV